MMRIVIDGDNFAGLVIPTPHPKDKPTFILYLFATQLSGETPKRTATQSPSFFSALLCTVLQRTTFTSKKSTANLGGYYIYFWLENSIVHGIEHKFFFVKDGILNGNLSFDTVCEALVEEFSVVVVIGCHQPESRVLTHALCVLLPIDWNLK